MTRSERIEVAAREVVRAWDATNTMDEYEDAIDKAEAELRDALSSPSDRSGEGLRAGIERLAAKWDEESTCVGARISYQGAASVVMKEHAAALRSLLGPAPAPLREPEAGCGRIGPKGLACNGHLDGAHVAFKHKAVRTDEIADRWTAPLATEGKVGPHRCEYGMSAEGDWTCGICGRLAPEAAAPRSE